MKKIIFLVLILLTCLVTVNAKTYDSVISYTEGECTAGATKAAVTSCDMVYHIIVDSTGTDLAFNIDLIETQDGVAYTFQTFTLTSASEPYNGLTVESTSASGNMYGGYATTGPVTARLYNASGLTACKVIVVYDSDYDYALITAAVTSLGTKLDTLEAGQLSSAELITAIGSAIFDDPANKLYTDTAGRIMTRNK